MSEQVRMRTIRQTIDAPLPYTKDEALVEMKLILDKLTFGQEIEIRRAKDRPSPSKSCKSDSEAYVTIAKVALVKVMPRGPA